MGAFYAKRTLRIEEPRVGLLNNGTEDSKCVPLRKESYALLQADGEKSTIHFIGSGEARDAMLGVCDVLVCDGFSGNVMLKSIEGTALFLGSLIKGMFTKNAATKLGYLLCKSGVKDLTGLLDYKKTGGSMLIGISKPVIKAHGSSDAEAVVGAVRQAIAAVNAGICEAIKENINEMTLPKEMDPNA
jgi:glycerol-3-phosphate acyltransferase PlsX